MTDDGTTPGLEELRLYDTRSRQVRRFEPLHPPQVGIYTCGPTVYAPQHLGNMRSQLLADLLKRTLLFEGYAVQHVINITDVGHLTGDSDAGEDKLEQAAARSGRSAGEIAAQYTAQWLRDRERLGCLAPEVLFSGGLDIRTTLDPRVQEAALVAVRSTLPGPDDPEAAVVVLDPAGGQVRALIGGRDWNRSEVNLALGPLRGTVGRQPGSSFKPFVLARALEDGRSLRERIPAPAEHQPFDSDRPVGNYSQRGDI